MVLCSFYRKKKFEEIPENPEWHLITAWPGFTSFSYSFFFFLFWNENSGKSDWALWIIWIQCGFSNISVSYPEHHIWVAKKKKILSRMWDLFCSDSPTGNLGGIQDALAPWNPGNAETSRAWRNGLIWVFSSQGRREQDTVCVNIVVYL